MAEVALLNINGRLTRNTDFQGLVGCFAAKNEATHN